MRTSCESCSSPTGVSRSPQRGSGDSSPGIEIGDDGVKESLFQVFKQPPARVTLLDRGSMAQQLTQEFGPEDSLSDVIIYPDRGSEMRSRLNSISKSGGQLIPTGLRRSRSILSSAIPAGLSGVDLSSVRSDVGDLWFPADDQVMLPYIAKNGTWEPEEGALLKSLARPGCRFLDVGQTLGTSASSSRHSVPDARIDCVEPSPLIVELLRLNLWAADVHAEVWPVALGNRSGARPRDGADELRRRSSSAGERRGHRPYRRARRGGRRSLRRPSLRSHQSGRPGH